MRSRRWTYIHIYIQIYVRVHADVGLFVLISESEREREREREGSVFRGSGEVRVPWQNTQRMCPAGSATSHKAPPHGRERREQLRMGAYENAGRNDDGAYESYVASAAGWMAVDSFTSAVPVDGASARPAACGQQARRMINASAADAVGRPGAQILIARRTPTNMMMMKETRSRAQPRRTGTPPRHRRGVAGRMKTVAAGPPDP